MKRKLTQRFSAASVIALTVGVALASGCHSSSSQPSSPEPQRDVSQPVAPASPGSAPAAAEAPRGPSGVNAPNLVDFTEGLKGEFKIDAWVPAPGHALVTLDGLPDGASFDASTGLLTWTPALGAADDPGHPGNATRYITVKLTVKSDSDPAFALSQEVKFIVHQAPRNTHIIFANSTLPLPEGQEFDGLVKIESLDTPNGTFTVKVDGLPVGASIEKGRNGREFILKYTPDRNVVTTKDAWSPELRTYVKTLDLVYHAYNAGGAEVAAKRQLLRIADSRVGPTFSGEDYFTVSGDADFTVTALDENAEQAPSVSLVSGPQVGTIEKAESADGVTSKLEVRWSGVPAGLVGKPQLFKFEACTGAAADDTLRCTEREVRVLPAEAERHPPVVRRDFWKAGLTRYVRQNDLLEVPVGILDGDSIDNVVDIDVVSSVKDDAVDFMNQKIRINHVSTPGPRTITVTARSRTDQKLVTTETFNLFVLPEGK